MDYTLDPIAPVTAALAAGGTYCPRTLDALRIADDDLHRVLEGTRHLMLDGGMGTMLQAAGLAAGELPELLCLTDPEAITAIHAAYVAAGSEAVTTNTFGANARKLGDTATVEDVFDAAVRCARASGARYVAGDIGPLGALLRPMGTVTFDEAYELFAQQARAAARAGVDFFIIETMTDLAEIRAAVLACRENTDLPIFATMTFEEDGRTFLGTSPEVAAITLDALGADVVGINCSLGPAELRPFATRMLAVTEKPVMVQANAGLPRVEDGATVYDVLPDAYAQAVRAMVDDGVGIIGGCCGTNPDYIRLLADIVADRTPTAHRVAPALTVTSAQRTVSLPTACRAIAVVGERINPTGKKRLQQALREGNLDYAVGQGIAQQEQGADVLDVNVGMPDIDEVDVLPRLCEQLSAATSLPLQVDSTDPRAIEAAVRRYAGKPIINSVNGKRESLEAVLPIAAHYGANIIGLTLDENGIPETAEARVRIAKRIVNEAARYGIGPERILIDCLVMTASTNQAQALEILGAVTACKQRLGVKCALGVSNISFGLPARELLNATFLAAAFGAGLDAPIMNPGSERYMDAVRAFRVLNAEDEQSMAYIERFGAWTDPYKRDARPAPGQDGSASVSPTDDDADATDPIRHLLLTGRKGDMAAATTALLADHDPLDLINERFIPALDEVGILFDKGTYFLPQLMASAEAARVGFDTIRERMGSQRMARKGEICLATVKGDIHDIGKNIVKMLLENYGFTVYDLGRDVDPHTIVNTVRSRGVKLVGLSALMTTTVRAMEETIALLRTETPDVQVIVGGAVLTPEYAAQIGADFYAKDAAATARIAEEVFGS
ncbi:homocysteine S-methyltransferase family protein [Collinsella tanakaei]|uniref:homocysteine S-methyltransferase family protein n=1 Tax=Collinsella tanakaei TaxID=626935 RepID=UPI0025A3D4D5|nr:homocysteine S-methyltransferase family protein [Collinsella tanakaei]MDM8302387.1 homocysteine S-methyltransferase family protein [Collinsella tanakaei]